MPDEPNRIELSDVARSWMRLAQAGANGPSNPDGLFGPGTPVLPTNPEESPRLFQYPAGINLVVLPRSGFGMVPFTALRNLAGACKEIRLNIELIKRQVRGLDFEITSVTSGETAANANDVKEFFESPDQLYDFDAWVNELLEELLVTDAVTLYPNNLTGKPIVELVDGTTIRPLIDFRGRTPAAPAPAYIQVLHGYPTAWFSADRMIYRPLNTSVSSPYGMSPIEWILMGTNLSLRRDASRINYFTEGNVPAAFAGLPAEWSVDQIEQYSKYMNSILQGDLARSWKLMFIPHNGQGAPVHEFQRNDVDKTELDIWLMQLACWAFGNSPSEFGLTPGEGLGGRGFMEGGQAAQYRSMIGPITQYLQRLFNFIIQKLLRRPDLRFSWIGLGPTEDKAQQAQVDQIYLGMGVYGVDWVQKRLGIPPEFRGKGVSQMPNPYGLTPTRPPVTLPLDFTADQGAAAAKFFQGRGEWASYG